MSKDCNCPLCRMVRKEITPSEYAGYLKGRIESRAQDINMKNNGKFGEDECLFRSFDSFLSSSLYDDKAELNLLLTENNSRFKPEKIDKAWLEPEEFIPRGNHEQDTTT